MSDISILNYEWSCPSCTYSNKPGSFKCHVCGTPKGTATRQTKYHSSTMEKQHMAETMSQQLLRFQLQSSRTAHKSSPVPSSTNSNNDSSDSSLVTEVSNGGSASSGPSLIINKAQISNTSSVIGKKKVRTRRAQDSSNRIHVVQKEEFVWPTLTNLDRSSGRSCQVTVDNVTVNITEYDLLYSDSD